MEAREAALKGEWSKVEIGATAVDTGFADRAAWERFATNLRTDAGAELEGI
jgi:hypothetical protein